MVSIGIDLGTTNCCVATWKHGMVEIIANDQGNRTTPSYVAFTSSGRLIGESAKNQAPLNPKNTIYSAKRLIGRRYDDIGVQLDKRHWPFYVTNEHGKPNILVQFKGEKKKFAPEEISSMILCRLKEVAEAYLGETVKHVVITVPAYFTDAQRQATRTAGFLAGLDVMRIINEPTAAAMAYAIERQLKGQKNVLIYDLGGGTLDVSVLKIDNGSVFEVMSTAGNTRLGGEDFDNRLVSYFAQDFENKYGTPILSNAKALRRLRSASERAKRCLTSATEALVEIESLHDGIDYYGKVSRAMFEELCSDLFKDTMRPVQAALDDARLPKNHIHKVVLVGGSTRIPKIQNILREFFNGMTLTSSINPDEAVAYGAAIQAAILCGNRNDQIKNVLLMDVVPLSLGVETARGLMYKVIERNTAIPCRQSKDITTLEDYQPALTIEVFEGERTLTQDNNLLGHFELTGIPLAPRGVPKIDVVFDVDADGILTVTAIDRCTGNSKGIVIKNESRLRPSEIERMVSTAKMFKEDDKERKLCLEARNQLETYIFAVKNLMKDNFNKLSAKEINFLAKECDDALSWLEDCSDALHEEFERKITELMKKWSGCVNQLSETEIKLRNLKRPHFDVEEDDDDDVDPVNEDLTAIEGLLD